MTPRVSCRLSATGIRFLGILFPPGASALLTVGLPGAAWTPAGFPRSAHPSHDRIGCPLYPEATRCSHGRSDPSGRRSPPLPGARPYRPGLHPIARGCLLRGVIEGSLAFTRPAFPLACNPRMERGLLGLDPRASHPSRQDLRRTPGRGTGIEHSPGATRPALPDLQSVHSLAMRDLASHDRHRYGRFPHPGQLTSWAKFAPGEQQSGGKKNGKATGTATLTWHRVLGECRRQPARRTPSSASATGGSPAAAVRERPLSRSPLRPGDHLAPALRPRGSLCATSALTSTTAGSATAARCATISASLKPSATKSP